MLNTMNSESTWHNPPLEADPELTQIIRDRYQLLLQPKTAVREREIMALNELQLDRLSLLTLKRL
jgi:hypothetical protein